MTQRATFKYNHDCEEWHHRDGSNLVEMCTSGLMKYVGIPGDVEQIDLVFHAAQPAGDAWFELYVQYPNNSANDRIRIKTNHNITWLGRARRFMSKQWQAGYRYVTVEY